MKIAVAGTILFFLLLQPPAHAEEQEEIIVITGELSSYSDEAVVVNEEKFWLCDDYEVLDTLEKRISIDGLVATETVTVAIKNNCAFVVKAEKIRR
jgi:hypothetical protein